MQQLVGPSNNTEYGWWSSCISGRFEFATQFVSCQQRTLPSVVPHACLSWQYCSYRTQVNAVYHKRQSLPATDRQQLCLRMLNNNSTVATICHRNVDTDTDDASTDGKETFLYLQFLFIIEWTYVWDCENTMLSLGICVVMKCDFRISWQTFKFLSKEVTTLRSSATLHFLILYTRKLHHGGTVICEVERTMDK
jgi:hypothetical protein